MRADSIPFNSLVELSTQKMTLTRSKILGRVQVTIGEGDGSKKFYASDLIKNTFQHLPNEEERAGANSILRRLQREPDPKPTTLIARICQKIARLFSKDSLAKLKDNPAIQESQPNEGSQRTPASARNSDRTGRSNSNQQQRHALELVRNDPNEYWNLSDEMRRDPLVAAATVDGFPELFREMGEEMRGNLDVALVAVRQKGKLLKFVSEDLKNNYDVLRAALTNDGLSLEHASDASKNTVMMVTLAVSQNGNALEFANPRMKRMVDIALIAVRNKSSAMEFVDDSIKDNPDIMAAIFEPKTGDNSESSSSGF